jgi:disulfide bond formation protein DsbB
MTTRNAIFTPLTLAVLALVIGPIGVAVFVLGFVHGDSPCVLCWAQRTGMVLIALTGLFVIRFGPRPRYIGLPALTGFGSTWPPALSLPGGRRPGFSAEILGRTPHLVDAFIYWISVVMMGMLLLV